MHDLGKARPEEVRSHAAEGALIGGRILKRLRYPTQARHHIVRIIERHAFSLEAPIDDLFARRFLAEHGDELADDLISHKEADLSAKPVPEAELEMLATLKRLVEQERSSPHRVADLAVTGDDLKAIGFDEGPGLGRAIQVLLAEVIVDPARNDRGWLLERAAEERP